MAIPTGGVALSQVGNDLGLGAGMNLGRDHARARVTGKKTGSISLGDLRGACTSMCVSHNPTWNAVRPTSVLEGFKNVQNGTQNSITSPSNDTTKDFNITVAGHISGYDAICELRQCGTCDAGTYNISGYVKSVVGASNQSPWSIAVVLNDYGWLQGNQHLAFALTHFDRNGYTLNTNFSVPAGWPYLTLVCYQFVYLHSSHGDSLANYWYPYETDFTDMRVKKI